MSPKTLISVFLFVAIFGSYGVSAMRQQAVAVKGILMCGADAASGVHVKVRYFNFYNFSIG